MVDAVIEVMAEAGANTPLKMALTLFEHKFKLNVGNIREYYVEYCQSHITFL